MHQARAGAGEEGDQIGVGVVGVSAGPVAGGSVFAGEEPGRAGNGGVESTYVQARSAYRTAARAGVRRALRREDAVDCAAAYSAS
ncbi:hypothetical protein SALBM311S_07401 [Streptomyces alboniger]